MRKSWLTTEFLTTLGTMLLITYLHKNDISVIPYLCALLNAYTVLRGLVKRFKYLDYTAVKAAELYCLLSGHAFVIYGHFHGQDPLLSVKLLAFNQLSYVISRSLTKQSQQKTQTVVI